jgi:hypothetical protein
MISRIFFCKSAVRELKKSYDLFVFVRLEKLQEIQCKNSENLEVVRVVRWVCGASDTLLFFVRCRVSGTLSTGFR